MALTLHESNDAPSKRAPLDTFQQPRIDLPEKTLRRVRKHHRLGPKFPIDRHERVRSCRDAEAVNRSLDPEHVLRRQELHATDIDRPSVDLEQRRRRHALASLR